MLADWESDSSASCPLIDSFLGSFCLKSVWFTEVSISKVRTSIEYRCPEMNSRWSTYHIQTFFFFILFCIHFCCDVHYFIHKTIKKGIRWVNNRTTTANYIVSTMSFGPTCRMDIRTPIMLKFSTKSAKNVNKHGTEVHEDCLLYIHNTIRNAKISSD